MTEPKPIVLHGLRRDTIGTLWTLRDDGLWESNVNGAVFPLAEIDDGPYGPTREVVTAAGAGLPEPADRFADGRAQALLDVGEAMSPTGEWPPKALGEIVSAVRDLTVRIDALAAAKDALTRTLALRDGELASANAQRDQARARVAYLENELDEERASAASIRAAYDVLGAASVWRQEFGEAEFVEEQADDFTTQELALVRAVDALRASRAAGREAT